MQFTKEDWISIMDCKSYNPLCENHSDVLNTAFCDANKNGINFREVAKFKFDNGRYVDTDPSEYASKKSFLVDEDDWDAVISSFKDQLSDEKTRIQKVRISYLARLVLSNYRMRLINENTPKQDQVKIAEQTIDGVELLQKVNNYAAELIKAGKIEKVLAFMEEE